MREEEAHIYQLLREKREEGLDLYYDRYASAIYGVVLRIVRRETLAEDVMQEAFLKIWNNCQQYDPRKGSLFTWGLNIARNTAIDKLRSAAQKRRQRTVEVDHATLHAHGNQITSPNVQTIGLKSLVSELETKYKEIIDLIYFRGFTQQEVHQELGIPLGTVKSRLRIGLRELRKHFNDSVPCWVPTIGCIGILLGF